MTILAIKSLKKDFGIKEILKSASFSIEDSDKVGLIGVNGSGKSTLLKILAGLELSDGGEMIVKSGARIIYLPQQPDIEENRTVLEQVFADCGEHKQLIQEYEELSHRIAHGEGENVDQLMGKLTQVSEKIESVGAWDLETNAKIILDKLGIQDFEAKMGNLSGGYAKRVALASALMAEPDLLLMDEPTNHLDAESVEWLQSYLAKYSGAIFLITHDRYFLDQVTNRILEIDRGDIYTYAGNYSYYLEKKALAEESAASSQRKFRGVLRRELEWLKRGPKARSTKQKARIDRIAEMQNKQFKEAQGKVQIDSPSRRIGNKVIEMHHVSKYFGDHKSGGFADRLLLKDFSYLFNPDDRIGIIGGNGVGKSTLMNLIAGRIKADEGKIEIGTTIKIGYFDQHSEEILTAAENQQRVIEYIEDVASYINTGNGGRISASQMLERFLFTPNQQYTPIHKLSGGEKRRLFLLRMLMSNPNVLLLDEPTNDLDVQTLAVLEEYIESFNGCVLIVSHDRYFLDRTVNTILAIESEGKIKEYPGNYSVYLDYKKREEKETKSETSSSSKTSSKSQQQKNKTSSTMKQTPRRLSNYQRRELEKLESVIIPELESQKTEIEKQLYQNPSDDYNLLKTLTEELANLNEKIDSATMKWMELAELDN